ncbi:MAG: AzlD domain-containing protein [Clostridia bacterium]|jgi:branched-subunit amino acid transport protein|nr:AzlD domain-containing protein [Clostridia bacterium]
MNNIYVYVFFMFAVTYAVRILPLTLIRKPIKSKFIKSFLFYVPYVTLAVMTFPAIIDASGAWWVGALTMAAGILAAWLGAGLFPVAAICCGIVFACSFLL